MSRKQILLIGAGRSTSTLIKYLKEKTFSNNFKLKIVDYSEELAKSKCDNHPNCSSAFFDVNNEAERKKLIQQSDVVISMLPPSMHILVVRDCIKHRVHMVTASYISDEMNGLAKEAEENGVIIMNEVGLDPGIDHMSAKKVIDEVYDSKGEMLFFESFTGGLISPEDDDNLWNYKFTWNPRNVVLAGQGGVAKFIQKGQYKYIPYNKLFRRTEFINIPDLGRFEAYANRDSLKYRKIYGLDDIPTIYRGTFRRVGFSRAWNIFVELGLTDDSYRMEGTENMTFREYINSFLPYHPYNSVEIKLRHYLKIDQDDIIWDKLKCLDLFSSEKTIGIKDATPAQALQRILEEKWTLREDDKDMIIMYHKFGFKISDKKYMRESYMVVYGDDSQHTAMAKTVGLPTAICALQILNGEINSPGILLPVEKEVYKPVLEELEEYGIQFTEVEKEFTKYSPDLIVD